MEKLSIYIFSFLEKVPFILSVFSTFLTLWVLAVLAHVKARSILKIGRTVIPEYDPPVGVSPILGNYILKSGAQGGRAGRVSISGSQILALITLHEKGLLSELNFSSNHSKIFYEVNSQFENLDSTEEEKILVRKILNLLGAKGVLNADTSTENSDGYEELNNIWSNYWYKAIYESGIKSGLILKSQGFLVKLLRYTGLSATFGLFFSIFFLLIPFLGWAISAILLLPILVINGIWYIIFKILFIVLPLGFELVLINFSMLLVHPIVFIVLFMSWFAMFMVFGGAMPTLNNPLSDKGKELRNKLLGYKMFLQKVDKDRLTVEYHYSNRIRQEVTTFSWLVVFELANDKHWEQWMDAHRPKEVQ